MTKPQEQALEQIKRLMRDHFDSAIFIWENEDPDTTMGWEMNYTGTGSHCASLGLVRYTENAMLNPQEDDDCDEQL